MLGFIPHARLDLKTMKSSGIPLLALRKEAITVIWSPFVSLSRFILMGGETQTQQFKSLNGIKDVIRKVKRNESKCETNIPMLKKEVLAGLCMG